MQTIELKLKRIAKKPNYTIGKLYVADETEKRCENIIEQPTINVVQWRYVCDTLEPRYPQNDHERMELERKRPGHNNKSGHVYCIPDGRYPVVIVQSTITGKWLPLLVNVPHFNGIRIHVGNFPHETKGCILVGENSMKGMVSNSRKALQTVMQLLVQKGPDYKPMFITIE